jgi:hypothetical protein
VRQTHLFDLRDSHVHGLLCNGNKKNNFRKNSLVVSSNGTPLDDILLGLACILKCVKIFCEKSWIRHFQKKTLDQPF